MLLITKSVTNKNLLLHMVDIRNTKSDPMTGLLVTPPCAGGSAALKLPCDVALPRMEWSVLLSGWRLEGWPLPAQGEAVCHLPGPRPCCPCRWTADPRQPLPLGTKRQ